MTIYQWKSIPLIYPGNIKQSSKPCPDSNNRVLLPSKEPKIDKELSLSGPVWQQMKLMSTFYFCQFLSRNTNVTFCFDIFCVNSTINQIHLVANYEKLCNLKFISYMFCKICENFTLSFKNLSSR